MGGVERIHSANHRAETWRQPSDYKHLINVLHLSFYEQLEILLVLVKQVLVMYSVSTTIAD